MATVYRCDICKTEKENRDGFLCSVIIPLAGRYVRENDAAKLETKAYDMCVDCAKSLNTFLEERKQSFNVRLGN